MKRRWSMCAALLLAACSSSENNGVGSSAGVSNTAGSSSANAGANNGGNSSLDGGGGGDSDEPDAPLLPTACGMPRINASPGNSCYDTPPPTLQLTPILNDGELFAPVMLASPPGDSTRLFVITRGGTVRIIKNGALLPEPFLDITDLTTNNNGESEHGLLGIAFDPTFASSGKIWIHYNVDASPIDSVTASVLVDSGNLDLADPATLTTLFTDPQPATNHNGGMLAFGPDGCLYLGYGDGGGGGDPNGFGQNTEEPMGSLLRIDAATGNPAPGNPGYGDPRIWSYGFRNPWRFSFDRVQGDLYFGDVGQDLWEEVDVEPAGTGDFNYGWNTFEGTHDYAGNDPTDIRMPIKEYSHDDGHSITGGYVYRGSAIAGLVGRYLYADYTNSRYWVLTYSGESDGQPQICDDYEITADLGVAHLPTAFGEDSNGELYILTLNGAIYRIDPG